MCLLPDQERAAAATLIARHPLAWVISRDFNASVLPLLAECDPADQITSVIGHCSRSNPLVADFARDPAGLVLFNGPAGYISTGNVSNPDWAPTWNFAVLRLEVEIEWLPEATADFVDRLLDHLEGKLPDRWSMEMLGARRAQMISRIIGFRAHVRAIRPHFKLGQDEAPATFREIVDGQSDRELVAWMEAFAQGKAP
jgi:transcriptional regulator